MLPLLTVLIFDIPQVNLLSVLIIGMFSHTWPGYLDRNCLGQVFNGADKPGVLLFVLLEFYGDCRVAPRSEGNRHGHRGACLFFAFDGKGPAQDADAFLDPDQAKGADLAGAC